MTLYFDARIGFPHLHLASVLTLVQSHYFNRKERLALPLFRVSNSSLYREGRGGKLLWGKWNS